MGHKFFRVQKLTIEQQIISMKRHFPKFSLTKGKDNVTWTGDLQPSPASEIYNIKLTYSLKEWPKVWVIFPELRKRLEGERIPHTFPDDRLCLFYPRAREWTRDMPIAITIVPWTSLWLYHYEIWHATGEWLGGGIHPPVNEEKSEEE